MNKIEALIFEGTKTNQKLMNTAKVILSFVLMSIFGCLFALHGNGVILMILGFLFGYILFYILLRIFFDRLYRYYRYVSATIDMISICILMRIITIYSDGIIVSLYFIPFLLTIIVISGLLFQTFYTLSVGLLVFAMSIYLFFFDGLLDRYAIVPLFFIGVIILASLYSSSNLKRIIHKISNLKQLEKYTDTGLLQQIEFYPDTLDQKGIEKELVIMFMDIRGFSKISENMPADSIFQLLNTYLGSFATIIEENHGTFDKYIGDCIMCHFDGDAKTHNSYATAIQILQKLAQLNQDSEHMITIGIGIHFGNVYAGSLGNDARMDHTIIGDNVNIASRLESLTREVSSDIVASKAYYDTITFENDFRSGGNYPLKGKDDTIDIYTL